MFERYAPANAITEPIEVQNSTSNGLECEGRDFYRYLLARDHGRLAWAFLGKLKLHDIFAYRHASPHKAYAAAEPSKGLSRNGIWRKAQDLLLQPDRTAARPALAMPIRCCWTPHLRISLEVLQNSLESEVRTFLAR